jgi:hypothetical protein
MFVAGRRAQPIHIREHAQLAQGKLEVSSTTHNQNGQLLNGWESIIGKESMLAS